MGLCAGRQHGHVASLAHRRPNVLGKHKNDTNDPQRRLSGAGSSADLRIDKLCDSAFETANAVCINLSCGNAVGFDIGMWFMNDEPATSQA